MARRLFRHFRRGFQIAYRKIQFVYLSIDDDFNSWQKANKKENLDNNISFLAINFPHEDFFKENQLASIPRYMIYYKGKLVNSDASGPNSQEIIKELDKYLTKK